MTGDEGDFWNDIKASNKTQRSKEGISCPGCKVARPRANPTILWSGKRRCKVCGMTWAEAKKRG